MNVYATTLNTTNMSCVLTLVLDHVDAEVTAGAPLGVWEHDSLRLLRTRLARPNTRLCMRNPIVHA